MSSSFAVHCVLLMASLLRSWSYILHSPILKELEHTKTNRVSNSSDLNLEDNGSNPENILYNQSKLIRSFLYGLVPLRAFSSWCLITICRKSEKIVMFHILIFIWRTILTLHLWERLKPFEKAGKPSILKADDNH